MAGFNEILSGRFSRGIQKLFSMKGAAATPSLASDIFATLGIDVTSPENYWLLGWTSYMVSPFIAAVAAQNSRFQIRNPTGSNVIAVIEKLAFSSAGGAPAIQQPQVQIGTPGALDLATLQQAAVRPGDTRQWAPPNLTGSSGSCIVSTDTAAGIGQIGATIAAASTSAGNFQWDFITTENQEIMLAPGWALRVVDSVVNAAGETSCWYSERFMEETERA